MKNYTTNQLHKNFILIHNFQYEKKNLKEWVFKDKTYAGIYHTDFNELFEIIKKIGEDYGYELVLGFNYSYWNKFGSNPLNKEFGGYENIKNIYQAVIEFIKWYK